MIPKVDYVIVYKEGEDSILNECVNAVEQQSNLNKLILEKIVNSDGAAARVRGLAKATTEYVAVVDYTCALLRDWFEHMWACLEVWNFPDILTGRAATHQIIKERLERTLQPRYIVKDGWTSCVESALMKRDALVNLQGVSYADVGELISKYCFQNNKIWVEVPVIAMRCPAFKYNAYSEGRLGCIGAIKAGVKFTRKGLVASALRGMIGGFMISLKEGYDIYFKREVMRGFGLLSCVYDFKRISEVG